MTLLKNYQVCDTAQKLPSLWRGSKTTKSVTLHKNYQVCDTPQKLPSLWHSSNTTKSVTLLKNYEICVTAQKLPSLWQCSKTTKSVTLLKNYQVCDTVQKLTCAWYKIINRTKLIIDLKFDKCYNFLLEVLHREGKTNIHSFKTLIIKQPSWPHKHCYWEWSACLNIEICERLVAN